MSHLPGSPSSLYAKKSYNSNNLLTLSSKTLRSWIRSIETTDVKLPPPESCSAEFLLLLQWHLFFNILHAFDNDLREEPPTSLAVNSEVWTGADTEDDLRGSKVSAINQQGRREEKITSYIYLFILGLPQHQNHMSIDSNHVNSFTFCSLQLSGYNLGFQNNLQHQTLSFWWKLFWFDIQLLIIFLVHTPSAISLHKWCCLWKMYHWPGHRHQAKQGSGSFAATSHLAKK